VGINCAPGLSLCVCVPLLSLHEAPLQSSPSRKAAATQAHLLIPRICTQGPPLLTPHTVSSSSTSSSTPWSYLTPWQWPSCGRLWKHDPSRGCSSGGWVGDGYLIVNKISITQTLCRLLPWLVCLPSVRCSINTIRAYGLMISRRTSRRKNKMRSMRQIHNVTGLSINNEQRFEFLSFM